MKSKNTYWALLIMICFLVIMILSSCEQANKRAVTDRKYIGSGLSVVVIDSCEYLYRDGGNNMLTHKGNCKFCKERNEVCKK